MRKYTHLARLPSFTVLTVALHRRFCLMRGPRGEVKSEEEAKKVK